MQSADGSLLVVDDNEYNRNMLQRRLQRSGYTVTEAHGGQQALEIIAQRSFDLVLLDIMMPDLDGLSVLKRLRQTYTAIELPVIMVTVKDQSDDIVEALNVGANDYLTKPIDFPIALARIRTHLAHKRAEDALKQTRDAALSVARQKAEFLAHMSHEIRTPMNGVLGMTTLLMQTELTDEQRELASIAQSSAETMLALINDILDSAKLEAGKMLLDQAPFDPRTTVEGVLDVVAEQAFAKQLDLVACFPPDLPPAVYGDAGRLRQILLNLVANAVKFTEHGEVRLEVSADSTTAPQLALRFAVCDTGIGISPAQQAELFQAFTQAAGVTTARLYGGTGLGLSLSQQLVTFMGGEMGVDSALGQGSVFWCRLPFGQVTSSASTPQVPAALRGARALVVEDHAPSRSQVQQDLAAEGVQSDGASSTAEALAALQAHASAGLPYDLVLLDAALPASEPILHVCAQAEATGTMSPQVILLVPLGRQHAALSRAPGVAATLTKPIKYASLCTCIETLLTRRPATFSRRAS